MAKKQVFYSFHFDNDVFRVQQIRNMGVLDGNEPVSVNEWEQVKKGGESAVKKWIDDNMKYKNCLVVLVGEDTANRPWVKYEIKKAWSDGRGVVGIRIHNLKCLRNGIGKRGTNPFEQFTVQGVNMSCIVQCYDPSVFDAYGDIKNNLESLVDSAIRIRSLY